jgi:hypothetical protein
MFDDRWWRWWWWWWWEDGDDEGDSISIEAEKPNCLIGMGPLCHVHLHVL